MPQRPNKELDWRHWYPHLDTTASQEKKKTKPRVDGRWEVGPVFPDQHGAKCAMILDEYGEHLATAELFDAREIVNAHNVLMKELSK